MIFLEYMKDLEYTTNESLQVRKCSVAVSASVFLDLLTRLVSTAHFSPAARVRTEEMGLALLAG